MRAPLKIQSSPKGKVNAAKSWIKVGLSNLSDTTPKRQFWSRENGRWNIIHETSL